MRPDSTQVLPIGHKTSAPLDTRPKGLELFLLILKSGWKTILSSPGCLLASPDALEVIVVSHSLTHSLSVSTDLTDVTLVSDDTNCSLD